MTGSVLVTGGHGVIGSWVCRELGHRGWRPIAFDLAQDPAVRFPDAPAPESVVGDLRDSDLLRVVLDRYSISRVLHLGAIVGEPAEAHPALALEVNAVATASLLDLATARGAARVVAMSTKGVLGPLDARYLHPRYEPVPVDLAPAPRSVYETTKLVVERLIARARERGLDAAAIRLATTWGPGKSGATHAGFSVHSDVVAAVAASGSARLDAHPEQGYDLVYYADVAAALVGAGLEERPLARPVYHVGSGRIITAREFAAAVEAAFRGARVGLGTRFPPGRNCLLDIGPATEDFDYRPAWPLARALGDIARRA